MKFQSKKILILIIVCDLVALAGYYFLFQYIKTQSGVTSSLTGTIDLSQQKNSHINSLRSMVKDTEIDRGKLTTFFLASDAEVTFIEKMEDLAKGSGLEANVNNVSSVPTDVSVVKVFQMQLATTGSWSSTLYFLSQVENLPYDVRVRAVSLSKAPSSGKAVSSWSAAFDVSVVENI